MKLEATDLRNEIATGMCSLVDRFVQMFGERGETLRPEYLTTASICFSLCDFAARHNLHLKIRSEEKTSDVWAKGLVKSLISRRDRDLKQKKRLKHRKSLQQRNSSRNGNVDITLLTGQSFEHPFAVIENKGMLNFTNGGSLYAGSRAEVEKDLRRNAEFVLRLGSYGGVQYAAFTFYLRDSDSALTDQGMAFAKEKRCYFERLLQSLNLHPNLRTNVSVKTLDDDLYASEEEARHTDENGAPAIDMHPPWHLLYGIISIYREGDQVIDARRLLDEHV